jgi:hypothetical protein
MSPQCPAVWETRHECSVLATVCKDRCCYSHLIDGKVGVQEMNDLGGGHRATKWCQPGDRKKEKKRKKKGRKEKM